MTEQLTKYLAIAVGFISVVAAIVGLTNYFSTEYAKRVALEKAELKQHQDNLTATLEAKTLVLDSEAKRYAEYKHFYEALGRGLTPAEQRQVDYYDKQIDFKQQEKLQIQSKLMELE